MMTPVDASQGASDRLGASGGEYGSLAHDIGLSPDVRHILSDLTPPARRAAPTMRLAGGLPDGLVAWRSFAKAHGIPQTTVAKALDDGRLPVVAGKWKSGRAIVERALDADGRRQFYALWGDREDFTRCPECPHA